jgi:MoaA/NifB/PqqE/SkfB family radical SAM enzyme
VTTQRYGFGGRLTEAFPSQVVVDVTEVCNLACVHCPHPDFVRSPHYASRYLPPELNTKLVDEVREEGAGATRYIRYSSEGEPLIHPRGYEMVDYAVRRSGVFVTLTTNGTILNEKRMRRLLDAGIHMVDISIDALEPDSYARIRVNGDLAVTRANVLRLIEWVRRDDLPTRIVVSFVEQPQNSGEAEGFHRFWTDAGAHEVVIRRLHSAAGAVIPVANIMRKSQQGSQRRPCLYPWERIVLNPRGFLAFCPADWTHGSSLVDFRDTSIAECWNSEAYRALRRAHLANDFGAHGFCGQCPDWAQTRWPDEGRSYADLVEELRRT